MPPRPLSPGIKRLAGAALRNARELEAENLADSLAEGYISQAKYDQVAKIHNLFNRRLQNLTPDEVQYLNSLNIKGGININNADELLNAISKTNPIYILNDDFESAAGREIASERLEAREYAQEEQLPRPVINAPLQEQINSYNKIWHSDEDPFVVWAERGGLKRNADYQPTIIGKPGQTVVSPVVQAAPVAPAPRTAKFVRTPNGVQSYVEKAGQGLVPHKLYATPEEASSAIASAQAAGWNVEQTVELTGGFLPGFKKPINVKRPFVVAPQPETVVVPPQLEPPPTQINSVTRTPQGLNTGATRNLNSVGIVSPEINAPEVRLIDGQINKTKAYYQPSDLANPRYAGVQTLNKNQYIPLEDALEDLENLQRYGVRLAGGDPSGGKAMVTSDLLLKNRTNAPNDLITGLGERQQSISDQYNILNNYRQELGEQIPSTIIPPKQFIISSNENLSPTKAAAKYQNVLEFAKQEGYLDNYPRYNPPLSPTNIVLNNVGGEAPLGMRAFAPESDSYSMAPQSAINAEQARDLLRFPTYPEAERLPPNELAYPDQLEFQQQNQNKDWYNQEPNYRSQKSPALLDANSFAIPPIVGKQPLYRYQANLGGMPTLPLDDPRVKAARLIDNAAHLDYQAEQQKQISKRSGSFNIVVDNTGHRDRVIEEGLYPGIPDDPADDVISGLKSNGKPYQIQVNADGQIKALELPNNIEVEIPGMGYFPLTGGATTDIHLGNQIAEDNLFDGAATMKEGQDLYLKDVPRDRSNRFMMDGFDALNAKRVSTKRAIAQYETAKRSSTVPPEALEQLAFNAKLQNHELQQAESNYAQAMRLEPQTSRQKVTVTVNSPTADDAIALLQSRGLKDVVSTQADNGYQISGSGEISLNDQMQLHSQLQQRFNPEQVLLPPGVSIANTSAAFKKADIPDKAFVQGVEWGKDAKGNAVIVNPGKPTGEIWQGQPIVVSNSVKQPTVISVADRHDVVNQPDPELQQLIAARDNAKKQRAVKLVELVNARRANRGEALLGIGPSGGLYRTEYPDSIFTMSPDDISNTVFSAAVRKQEPFSDETAAVLNQGLHNAAIRQRRENINSATANSPETYNQTVSRNFENVGQPLTVSFGGLQPYTQNKAMPNSKLLDSRFISDWEEEATNLKNLAQQYNEVQRRKINPSGAGVEGRAAIQNENAARAWRMRGQGRPIYGSNQLASPWSMYSDPTESVVVPIQTPPANNPVRLLPQATPAVRPATVNLNELDDGFSDYSNWHPTALVEVEQSVRLPSRPADLRWIQSVADTSSGEIPPDLIQMARARMPVQNAASPRPTEIPTSAPERVQMVEEPRTNYIPAAVALGALGLGGAGIGYAMTRPREDDEEMQRQQRMHHYIMQHRAY